MKYIRFWLPVIVWMAVIFSFSARQKVAVTDSYILSFIFFKTLHIIEYMFLYVVSFRAVKNTVSVGKRYHWIIPFCIVTLYAISDEVHQLSVPTREGRLRDVIIDMVGAAIAWIILKQLLQKTPKKLRNLVKLWQLKY